MFNLYPYTDFHELNLDVILRMMKDLHKEWTDFEAVNKITNAGSWDITKQYQAWTVVSDNNIGYISLKPVPAGVAITNIEYWGVVADYDILITDLSNRISTLEYQMSLATGRIATLENEFAALDDHKYIFISDSYGARTTNWINAVIARLGLTSDNYYSNALSGAGFKPSYNSYFITLLQNLESSITDKDKITDIIVVGGFNDRDTSLSDLNQAISDFCDYAISTYPNAKIWIGGAGWSMNGEFIAELHNGRYLSAYKDCTQYGAFYISGIDYIMHNFDNYEQEPAGGYTLHLGYQYVHPNTNGCDRIANAVVSNLMGVPYHFRAQKSVTVTPATGITIPGDGLVINQIVEDDNIYYTLEKSANVQFSSPQASSYSNYKLIGTLEDGCIAAHSASGYAYPNCSATGFIAGGTQTGNTLIPLHILIADNRVYAKVNGQAASTYEFLFLTEFSGSIPNIVA